MRILVDITHPAHVHFFRNAISELEKRGHVLAVTARDKDVAVELLKNFGIEHAVLSKVGQGLGGLFGELVVRDWRLWKFCRKFKPDVLTAISGVYVAHVGALLGRPSVIWDDTEHQTLAHKITWPLAASIHSPDCYLKPPGKKQHLYPGCHELAYLHPNRFQPDAKIVKGVGIDPQERYCIVRFISWAAHHDVGRAGLTDEKKAQLLEELGRYARPYVTSESGLPAELEAYKLRIPAHQIHHVLAFASLCVTEGATMALEAALLAVPTVYINPLPGGTINKLKEFGLILQTTDTQQALQQSLQWLKDTNIKEDWKARREKVLEYGIDLTDYIVETIESAGRK